MLRPSENLGLILGFAGTAVFAGTLPAMRLAVAAIDPWFLTMGRASVSGAIALAILVVLRRPLPPRPTWPAFAISAFTVALGFPLFSAIAMVTLPAAHGGVVLGVLPLATAAAAALIAHERPSLAFWLASVLGAALVVAFAVRRGAGSFVGGDVLLLAAVACAAIGYSYSGRLSLARPGWEVICWGMVLLLPISVPGTIALWPADAAAVPATVWLCFAYVAVMSQLVGFFAWNAGLALGGIARVGQTQLLQPFLGIAFAALVNQETIDLETVLFAAAVVATVMAGRATRVTR